MVVTVDDTLLFYFYQLSNHFNLHWETHRPPPPLRENDHFLFSNHENELTLLPDPG